MYKRRINGANCRWVSLFHQSMHWRRPLNQGCVSLRSFNCSSALWNFRPHGSSYLIDTFLSRRNSGGKGCASLTSTSGTLWRHSQYRLYSSEGDGGNTNKDKHAPVKDGSNFDCRKNREEIVKGELKYCDSHARLADQDQKEWINNEKLLIESRNKEMPFLTRREKFKNEFLRRIVPWGKIQVSWENFPYYIDEHAKNTLVECAAAHLKQEDAATSYGARLNSSSGRILLQSVPGSELYRERIVRALARDLKVPLLVLDSSVLSPYDFGDDYTSECESDDNTESGEECASESEVEDESEATNEEEWTSSNANKSDCTDDDLDDVRARAEVALKKLVPFIEGFERRISGEGDSSSKSSKPEVAQPSDSSDQPIKKGDRVKYKGPHKGEEANNRNLSTGLCGEVYEVLGDRVAVLFDIHRSGKASEGEREEKQMEQAPEVPVHWVHENDIERLSNAEAEDCFIAMEVLSEVLDSAKPLIVYFSDLSLWLSNGVPKSKRKDFIQKMQAIFDELSGPVVLICGHHKVETGSKEKEGVTMILPGPLVKLPLPYKLYTERLKSLKRSNDEFRKLFTNVLSIPSPNEEDHLRRFNKQIEEDRRIVISRSNLNELHKVIEENEMSCLELLNLNTDGVILTKRKAEQIVGWARNHYLSSCPLLAIKGDRLLLPRESLEIAILRLKEQEMIPRKQTQNLKNLAKDEYESNFVSAVVPPGEIGVKFDDIGALEDVKKALNELVILPMKRPELFSHGNLLRPCKGILLFGPPGTGKTLLAKALATEAGANFISITGSNLTSKWFGDAEKLTKALFSFANKLAPVIIFVDEVDSLLGARGGSFEHEATRKMRNEFMAAWDGLRSKDSQRILILGATNRPFDLDDAVIRRLPRRIYVDLPDANNRKKILKIILANENLEPNFTYEKLANATDGYSGSDLKNLCVAAAYRPVQELLEEEKKADKDDAARPLRSLNLDDFIQSKAKVGPSVAYDAASMNELRKWNEQYGEGGSRRKSPFGFGDK